jgi:hypothetical protein
MQVGRSFRRALALAVLLGVLPIGPAFAGEVIGRVVSVDGDVFAEAPREEPRRLRCGDPIRREDMVTTTFGGRLGVLVGNVHARMGDGTQTRFDLTPEGAPTFFVTAGRLHVIDARVGDAPPVRISTPQLTAEATGMDTDLWVGDPDSLSATTLCESGADLHVTLGGGAGSVVTSPGQCAEIGPRGDFGKEPRQLAPLGGAGDPCSDLLSPVALHYRDPGLAVSPLPLAFPDPRPVPDPPRGPCDGPAAGCVTVPTAGSPTSPPVPPVVEQPVVGCQIPGLCTP